MSKPKTVKGFLTLLIRIADYDIYNLKDWEELADKDQRIITGMLTELQNSLSEEDAEILLFLKDLRWKG